MLIWLKLNVMFFLELDYYCHHFCSHVIGTFQERGIKDALYRSVERLTNVNMMFSQPSTTLIKHHSIYKKIKNKYYIWLLDWLKINVMLFNL